MRTLLLLATVLSGCPTPSARPPDPEYGAEVTATVPAFRGRVPRNLIMVSIDTLRKDHVDRYASPDHLAEHGPSMPFLSSLFDQGVPLDDFTQCSNWTFASTSCTLAGRSNVEAGMVPLLNVEERTAWAEGTPFLAGYLAELGFYSVLATTNGFLSSEWGNAQGYQQSFSPFDASALGTFRAAVARLEQAQEVGLVGDRWFLHLHLLEPHAPYSPPQPYLAELEDLPPALWDLATREQHYEASNDYRTMTEEQQALLEAHLSARYRADLRWLDDQLFQIYQELQTSGMLDDALLVVWSDHGEAFWEHRYHTHALTLHREETDAVATFWAKNIVPEPFVRPTSAVDLVPTLLDLWTGEVPAAMTGEPLRQISDERARFAATTARLGTAQSIERAGWKLIYPWQSAIALYDRSVDPQETTNLYSRADPPAKARELWQELRPRVEARDAALPDRTPIWPAELDGE